MRLLKKIRALISSIDMFYSSELLRYDNDTQYKTLTGGFITAIIIIMVTVSFFAMISDTLNRTAISSALTVTKSQNPSKYDLVTDSQHNFMFGIQIQSTDLSLTVNLNEQVRYFDVQMITQEINYGVLVNQTSVSLVQCTDEHWSLIPEMKSKSQEYGYSNWACPELGQVLPLQGSYTSDVNYINMILISPCNNQTDLSRPCAAQEAIDALMSQYGNFYLAINYINPVINPTSTNYISYYLQGQDYVIFSQNQGCEAWFEFSDYQIITDNSILPFSQYYKEVGAIVQYKAINHPFSASNVTGYVNAFFSKSSNSLQYQRAVQKISAVFSYIGGLIGALTAVLFLMKTYTDTSLELTIAIALFRQPEQPQPDQPQQSQQCRSQQEKEDKSQKQQYVPLQNQSFNFKSFVKLMAYRWLSAFSFSKNWKSAQMLYEFRKEIVKQLDIKTLLRRIISIQSCMGILFDQDQLQSLKFRKNVDLDRARKLRELLVPNNIEDLNAKTITNFTNKVAPQEFNTFKPDDQILSSPQIINKFMPKQRQQNESNLSRLSVSHSIRGSQMSSEIDIGRETSNHKSQIHLKKLRQNAFKTDLNGRIWKNLKEHTKKFIENDILSAKNQTRVVFQKQTGNKEDKKKKAKKQEIRFENLD